MTRNNTHTPNKHNTAVENSLSENAIVNDPIEPPNKEDNLSDTVITTPSNTTDTNDRISGTDAGVRYGTEINKEIAFRIHDKPTAFVIAFLNSLQATIDGRSKL